MTHPWTKHRILQLRAAEQRASRERMTDFLAELLHRDPFAGLPPITRSN